MMNFENGWQDLEKLLDIDVGNLKFDLFESLENICRAVKLDGKKIVLYGAGEGGRNIKCYLERKGIEIDFFCDSDSKKWGNILGGKEIVSPDALGRDTFVVITSTYEKEIAAKLLDLNIEYITAYIELSSHLWKKPLKVLKENFHNVLKVFHILEDEESKETFKAILSYMITRDPLRLKRSRYPQYVHPYINFSEISNILDGGAYPGDFADFVINNFQQIHCYLFEPDPYNFQFLLGKYAGNEKVTLIRKALYSVNSSVKFTPGLGQGSYIDQERKNERETAIVETITLDFFVHKYNVKPDYIKMDIEGAEMEALIGARDTLVKVNPKLAVCLYHSPEHLFSIPLFVKEINPRYKLFLGHHNDDFREIVLYAL
jgi:FkbM family methyltransferase